MFFDHMGVIACLVWSIAVIAASPDPPRLRRRSTALLPRVDGLADAPPPTLAHEPRGRHAAR